MTKLPPKRRSIRTEILKGPKREWPRHRAWVRKHSCSVPGCNLEPIECAHIRTAANSGTGLKPPDWDSISLCHDHHFESHQAERSFEKKYGLDLMAIAHEFARQSPDTEMKEAMKAAAREEDGPDIKAALRPFV